MLSALRAQAFETMNAKGCKPDSIVYNAIIDALWETGLRWPQRHAARLFRHASCPLPENVKLLGGECMHQLYNGKRHHVNGCC